MASEAQIILRQVVRARYRPRALALRGWQALAGAAAAVGELPQDIARLLRRVRHGRVQVAIDIAHLKRVGDQIDRAASRLALALVIAALIIGSSIVMTVGGGPRLLGLPAFGLLGFIGAIAGGLWLLRSIRQGRHPGDDDQ
jgi:ubiquinone biosynthesis protein